MHTYALPLTPSVNGRRLRWAMVTLLSCTALLAACASTPPAPEAAIGAATQAIASADRSGVGESAAPELAEARSKLAAANLAVADKRMTDADRLARESRIDAELASARTQTIAAQRVNDEITRGTAVLSTELQRHSGEKP